MSYARCLSRNVLLVLVAVDSAEGRLSADDHVGPSPHDRRQAAPEARTGFGQQADWLESGHSSPLATGLSRSGESPRQFRQAPVAGLRGFEQSCSYGPCPCVSRGTLLQWSYGTSFRGGPDLDEPLVTDRPDFTEASVTVGRGVAQLEFGYTYTYNADEGTSERVNSWGEPLLRYGIFADWLELRLGLFPVEERITSGGRSNTTAGTEDLHLGLKWALTPQEGWLPETAVITQMNVPTGSNAFTDDEAQPGVNWLYSWEINDFVSTGGSTQLNRAVDETTDRSYTEIAQSWTFAYTLTEALGAYTEWYAIVPHSADTDQTQHFFNGGFTYLINDDVQWDIRAGVGLNDAADDYFLGSGLSIRFQ